MTRDLFEENNINTKDLFAENNILTNETAINSVLDVENINMSWYEKTRNNIKKNFQEHVDKWNNPMSWVEFALKTNPMISPVANIYFGSEKINEKSVNENVKTAEKYGALPDKPIQITDGIIAQMDAEGEINAGESFKRQGFTKTVPFLSSFAEIKNDINLIDVIKKYNAGQKLSAGEMQNLNGYILHNAEMYYRGTTFGGKFVPALLEMPAYAGEFLLTDGIGTAGKQMVKASITKGLQDVTKKQIGKRIVKGTVETAGDALLRTSIGMPHRVIQSYGERRLNAGLTVSDKGDKILRESLEKPVTSFFKAYADVFIENLSELSGAGINLGLGATGRFLKKRLPKGAIKDLYKFARATRPNAKLSEILSKTGFNGILEEYGEERLGNLLRVFAGLDESKMSNFEKIGNAIFPSFEQSLIEFGLFSIYGGGSHIAYNLANSMLERRAKSQEIKKVFQSTSQLEKEEIHDNFILKPKLEKAHQAINDLHDEFISQAVNAGLSEDEAIANASIYKDRLHSVYVKYGKELENNGIDFEGWYKNRLSIVKQDIINPPSSGKTQSNKITSFKPDELETDAKTFQYKSDTDENGISERLKDVMEFEPLYAGQVMVYETKEGKKYIVDGHQRLGLAKRSNASNVELSGFIYKESDGYTPQDLRIMAAKKNISENSGSSIDTAKIVREIGVDNIPSSLSRNSAIVKNGISLSKLSNEAFQKVINKEVTPQQGAIVAEHIQNNSVKQIIAIDIINKAKPENLEQVAMYAQEVLYSDYNESEQTNLFGTEQIFESHAPTKIRIVDKALKQLRSDKKVFSTLSRNHEKIEQAGNNLKSETNEQIEQQAQLAINAIQRLSSMKGEICNKANELAKNCIDGIIDFKQAVGSFKDFVTGKDVLNSVYGNLADKIFYQSVNNNEGNHKARIRFTEDSKAIIDLFSKSDSSSLPHELAHYFLHDLSLLAEHSRSAMRDLCVIDKWLAHKTGEEYTAFEQEKFARAFEKYLLTNEAPNIHLRSTFENFREWLKTVAKNILDNNIPISEDIRQSFDNLFLTDVEYLKSVQDLYFENTILQKNINNQTIVKNLQTKVIEFRKIGQHLYDKMFIPLDSRLEKINSELANKVRRFTYDLIGMEKTDQEAILPFLEKAKMLEEEEFYTLDLALKNRDTRMVNLIVGKCGIEKEYQAVRKILDELYDITQEVGMDVNYMNMYFPRMIKAGKLDNFLEYIDLLSQKIEVDIKVQYKKTSGFDYSRLLRELSAADKNGVWTLEDKAKFIDSQIRGFGQHNILLARIGQLKFDRTIPKIDKKLNVFYAPFTETLPYYVANTRKTVESRRFLGSVDKETGKFRASLKQKKTTLKEVLDRPAWLAKAKEIKRLKYKLSGTELNYEEVKARYQSAVSRMSYEELELGLDKIKDYPNVEELKKDVKNLEKAVKYLENEIQYIEATHPFTVKKIIIRRLNSEIEEITNNITENTGKYNIEDNIGVMVNNLVSEEIIKAEDEKLVRDILQAKFNYGTMKDATKWVRDIGYLGTLNDFTNTLTQFTDLSFAFYKQGFFDASAGMFTRKEITVKDIGLANIGEEFKNNSGLSKLVNGMFKVIGFEKVDAFGKNVLMNSSVKHARRLLKKGDVKMRERIELLFGSESEQVIKDLIAGNITPDVRYYAFNELAKVQPITLDQLPELYAKGGIYRLMYSLKSYTLKMLDVVRQDIFMQFKKSPARAIINLARFQMFLLLFGLPKDYLKDLISNREFNLPESVLDNLVICQLINRYTMRSVAKDGLGSALFSFVQPPAVRMLDDTVKAVFDTTLAKGKKRKDVSEVYAWNYVPIAGSFFYDWLGGGVMKRAKKHQELKKK